MYYIVEFAVKLGPVLKPSVKGLKLNADFNISECFFLTQMHKRKMSEANWSKYILILEMPIFVFTY